MDTELSSEEMLRLLKGRSLGIWDEAPLLLEYIRRSGITQSECAVRLGRSQPAVANRLRLLQFPPEMRLAMRKAGLNERHARALLRLPTEALRRAALDAVTERRMSVSETESYVDALLRSPEQSRLCGLWTEIRRLLDEGICAGAAKSAGASGLTLTLFFPDYRDIP